MDLSAFADRQGCQSKNCIGPLMRICFARQHRSCVHGAQAFSLLQAIGRLMCMSLVITSFPTLILINHRRNWLHFCNQGSHRYASHLGAWSIRMQKEFTPLCVPPCGKQITAELSFQAGVELPMSCQTTSCIWRQSHMIGCYRAAKWSFTTVGLEPPLRD